jgi:DNA-binding response OmpR family regulator
VKLVKLGLKDYIAKPFTREVFLEKLNPILGLYDGNGGQPEKPVNGVQDVVTNPGCPTILAIDDKSNILDMLKDFLGGQFNLLAAHSGQAGISAVALKAFDYMILDLSMPEVSGFEVLESYIQSGRNQPDVRKVIAMSLRTAQEDIDRAISMGISAFLYKPFSREDVAKAVDKVKIQQKPEQKIKARYLIEKGKIRILECPPEKSSKYREVAASLKAEIMREINDMAEEGLSQLIIKVGEGFLSDIAVTRKFVDLIEHIVRLSLNIRFVADSDQAGDALSQFAETAGIPRDVSLECALHSIQ